MSIAKNARIAKTAKIQMQNSNFGDVGNSGDFGNCHQIRTRTPPVMLEWLNPTSSIGATN